MRAAVDYAVTEQCAARLKGKTLRQRAQALLAIADPACRDQIVEEGGALMAESLFCRRPGEAGST
jgi:acyl-CoA hydrolase